MWRAPRSQRDLFDEAIPVLELRPDLGSKLALLLQSLLAEAAWVLHQGESENATARGR